LDAQQIPTLYVLHNYFVSGHLKQQTSSVSMLNEVFLVWYVLPQASNYEPVHYTKLQYQCSETHYHNGLVLGLGLKSGLDWVLSSVLFAGNAIDIMLTTTIHHYF